MELVKLNLVVAPVRVDLPKNLQEMQQEKKMETLLEMVMEGLRVKMVIVMVTKKLRVMMTEKLKVMVTKKVKMMTTKKVKVMVMTQIGSSRCFSFLWVDPQHPPPAAPSYKIHLQIE